MRIISSTLLAVQLLSIAPTSFAASMINAEDIAMEYAMTQGILSIQSDGLEHAEAPLTRIDLVRGIMHDVYEKDVQWGCFGLIAPKPTTKYTHLFTDIPKTYEYAQEICAGMLAGVVQGKKDGSFQPNAGATLSEAAKVIAKSYGLSAPPALMPESVRWDEPYWYALARRNVLPSRIRDLRDEVLTRGEFASIMFQLRNERPKFGAQYEATHAKASAQDKTLSHAASSVSTVTPVTDAGMRLQKHAAERLETRLAVLAEDESAALQV